MVRVHPGRQSIRSEKYGFESQVRPQGRTVRQEDARMLSVGSRTSGGPSVKPDAWELIVLR